MVAKSNDLRRIAELSEQRRELEKAADQALVHKARTGRWPDGVNVQTLFRAVGWIQLETKSYEVDQLVSARVSAVQARLQLIEAAGTAEDRQRDELALREKAAEIAEKEPKLLAELERINAEIRELRNGVNALERRALQRQNALLELLTRPEHYLPRYVVDVLEDIVGDASELEVERSRLATRLDVYREVMTWPRGAGVEPDVKLRHLKAWCKDDWQRYAEAIKAPGGIREVPSGWETYLKECVRPAIPQLERELATVMAAIGDVQNRLLAFVDGEAEAQLVETQPAKG